MECFCIDIFWFHYFLHSSPYSKHEVLGEGENERKLQMPSSLCLEMERAGALGQTLSSWKRSLGTCCKARWSPSITGSVVLWQMLHSCPLSAELMLGDEEGKTAFSPAAFWEVQTQGASGRSRIRLSEAPGRKDTKGPKKGQLAGGLTWRASIKSWEWIGGHFCGPTTSDNGWGCVQEVWF